MTAISITPGYPTFADTDGSPLNDGYVFIGLEYQDPITAPTTAFWDKDFRIPADQPLRTSGGYVVRDGSPAAVYTGAAYSILVQNKNLVTVYNAPSAVITNVTNDVEIITQYQGAHATDPVARNDGTPLQTGDLYFNTVVNELKVWTGTVWVPAVPGTVTVENFTGTGAQTAFNLATAPVAENNTQIYIDGVYQQKDTYTLSGATINFSTAPPNLSGIEVVTFSIASLGTVDASNVSYNEGSAGAVNRSVQDKLQESVSVKDFGAVGDGVVDDTAAINLAYAAAASLRARLYVPSGVYKITSELRWIGEVPVYGDGGGQGGSSGTQFLKVGNFTAIFISSSEGIEYCGFSVVQSGGPSGGGGGKGVDIYWGNRMKFHDIWIEGHSFYGLHVRAGNVASYKDVNIINCGDDGARWDSGTGWGAGSNEVGEGSPGAQTAQGCYVENFDIRSCNSITAGAAFNIQIGRQNIYQSLVLQNNSDKGLEVNTEGNIITYYSESNGASELFTASSQGNFITITLTAGYTDSGANNSIFDYNQAGAAAFGWTKCFINKGLFQDQDFAVASSPWQIYETGNALVHELTIMDAGSAAKQGTVRIKHNAGTTANLAVEGSVSVKRVLSNDNVYALDNTGTPDVSDSNLYLTGGTTSISDFDGGILGQTLKIRANHSVTIVHSATVNLSGSVNYAMTPGDTLVLTMYEDQIWNEDSRAVL
jgi:hypothetical protein